jgi:hypothetical protein
MARDSGGLNRALLSMPSVVAADRNTTASLERTLGISSSSGQLFKIGRSERNKMGGSKQPVEIFSYLRNDNLIISESRDFEISSGAQMQLVVGMNRK